MASAAINKKCKRSKGSRDEMSGVKKKQNTSSWLISDPPPVTSAEASFSVNTQAHVKSNRAQDVKKRKKKKTLNEPFFKESSAVNDARSELFLRRPFPLLRAAGGERSLHKVYLGIKRAFPFNSAPFSR